MIFYHLLIPLFLATSFPRLNIYPNTLLKLSKERIRSAQYEVMKAVNKEMIYILLKTQISLSVLQLMPPELSKLHQETLLNGDEIAEKLSLLMKE